MRVSRLPSPDTQAAANLEVDPVVESRPRPGGASDQDGSGCLQECEHVRPHVGCGLERGLGLVLTAARMRAFSSLRDVDGDVGGGDGVGLVGGWECEVALELVVGGGVVVEGEVSGVAAGAERP